MIKPYFNSQLRSVSCTIYFTGIPVFYKPYKSDPSEWNLINRF
jgi:hypothetical protein